MKVKKVKSEKVKMFSGFCDLKGFYENLHSKCV